MLKGPTINCSLCAEQRQKLHAGVWEGRPSPNFGEQPSGSAPPPLTPTWPSLPTSLPLPRPPEAAHALTHRCPRPPARGREPPAAAAAAAAPRRQQPPSLYGGPSAAILQRQRGAMATGRAGSGAMATGRAGIRLTGRRAGIRLTE